MPASGQAAVEKAAGQSALSAAEAPAAPDQQSAGRVRIVGPRTFILSEGAWVDTAFDPDQMQPLKVAFLSEDYFALAESRPDLAAAFALGRRVIALSDGTAYGRTGRGCGQNRNTSDAGACRRGRFQP
jgi:hypothetical protein